MFRDKGEMVAQTMMEVECPHQTKVFMLAGFGEQDNDSREQDIAKEVDMDHNVSLFAKEMKNLWIIHFFIVLLSTKFG